MRPLTADVEPPIGAQVVTQRSGYRHHGIYAGDGLVVHYAGRSRSLHRGPVQQVSLGEDQYRLTINNCEHFCVWCMSGESRSEQIERWLGWPQQVLDVALNSLRALFNTPAAAVLSTSAS